ncbi:GNAT family N-acetyltransferase [Pseudomonas argentinensis]|uniref:Acetyltransferase (GNAT) family protein n=1 Tax=Phytopseudomonas argentinensis TaxID=289370 RepID=A0A1I3KPF2_9GAMM|nr:GNAT family N-acetyltransferase [Pseudomonas argentinensis]KAB0550485.1 GNAT family N-acetyltransferase [Pseudomonas argentinensis]SFI74015.1 Acetyltransferase (GNAT) family protein [Pseudomonas argentinensis]
MFTLTHLNATPPESLKAQVLQMVVDYFSDISPVPLTPSNPLYQLYQYVIGYEVHMYLQAMNGEPDSPTQLLLALDDQDPSVVLGFALYLPSQDDADACTLAYMAVAASHRRRGNARAMLQRIIERHPHMELACVAGKVPTFEAMGFQVLAAQGPQVLMNTRDQRSDGLVAVQDLAPVFQSTEVRQIHAYLLKQHGKKAMSEAEKQRDYHLDQLAHQARQLVAERLTPTLH